MIQIDDSYQMIQNKKLERSERVGEWCKSKLNPVKNQFKQTKFKVINQLNHWSSQKLIRLLKMLSKFKQIKISLRETKTKEFLVFSQKLIQKMLIWKQLETIICITKQQSLKFIIN